MKVRARIIDGIIECMSQKCINGYCCRADECKEYEIKIKEIECQANYGMPKCFVPEHKNANECLGWSKDTNDDEPLEMCKKCAFCSVKYEESEGEG